MLDKFSLLPLLILALTFAILKVLIEVFVLVDETLLLNYYNSLNQFTQERIELFLERRNDTIWVPILFEPALFFGKLLLIAISLSAGLFIMNQSVSFKELLKVVLFSELVYVFAFFGKCVWFLTLKGHYSFLETKFFSPLSLCSIFDCRSLPIFLVYPAKTLGFIQLVYFAVLAWFLKHVLDCSYRSRLQFVAITYLPALIFWIIVVMFVGVTFT